MSTASEILDCVVIGSGVAGLAAASALSHAGARVALVDRKPFVAGRAYSYLHPALDEVVDSQHILVGCCTNLRHLCATAGASDQIKWYDQYTFLEPGGRRSDLKLTALPAPLHTAPSFAQIGMLSLRDKFAIASALKAFLRGYSHDDTESVAMWLRRTRQPEAAIRHFWEPILVGALNDTLDRCSMRYAGQVVYETFLGSAEGGRFGIPRVPLSEFFGTVADACVRAGTLLQLKQNVSSLQRAGDSWRVCFADGDSLEARTVISAVSFEHVASLLGPELLTQSLPHGLERFVHAPITTVHLWYDQPFTDLEHAVLLDTGIQWMFQKSRIREWPLEQGVYVELTISASHAQLKQSREALLARSQEELASFFPSVATMVPRKAGVLKEAKATFSVVPGLDAYRPMQQTAVPGLMLAGDWTMTGWPSTMEGGVRSGYLAAEAVARFLGTRASFLQEDLPVTGLMALLARKQEDTRRNA